MISLKEHTKLILATAKKCEELSIITLSVNKNGKKCTKKRWQETTLEECYGLIVNESKSFKINIGILTRKVSGIWGFDIDSIEVKPFQTMKTVTHSGKLHFYFKYSDKVKHLQSGTERFSLDVRKLKLDIRSDGAYLVAGGSAINGKYYTSCFDIEPQEIPADLLEVFNKTYNGGDETTSSKTKPTKTIQPITITTNEQITKPILKTKIVMKSNLKQDVEALIKLMSKERIDNYSDWIKIGMCLHNINPEFLNLWIEVSKQSAKFQEGVCEEKWNSFKANQDNQMTMGSLHHWAKNDNPEGYKAFKYNNLRNLILKCVKSQEHDDLAAVIYHMYKDLFVFSSKCWFLFENHRWREIKDGFYLRNLITSEVVAKFWEVYKEDKDKNKGLLGAISKLKDNTQQNGVMSQLKNKFYVEKFLDKLDKDIYLIGFENGVYDLNNGEFRDGRPIDYITKSVGYDYEEFKEDHNLIADIYRFMTDIFPNAKLRDYVLLSTFLEGMNKKEQVYIWTGVGGNGKSKLMFLLQKALGQYCSQIQSTSLTKKRGGGEAPSPMLANCQGARCVFASEPEEGSKLNTGLIKECSGNDKVICRPMYGKPIAYDVQFKMILMCNELPQLSADDEGIWRRMRVVPFNQLFVDNPDPNKPHEMKKDVHIMAKLNIWKSAFMFILLQHYKIYKKHDIGEPQDVLQATSDYKKVVDTVQDFINDQIVQIEYDQNKTDKFFRKRWDLNLKIDPKLMAKIIELSLEVTNLLMI